MFQRDGVDMVVYHYYLFSVSACVRVCVVFGGRAGTAPAIERGETSSRLINDFMRLRA